MDAIERIAARHAERAADRVAAIAGEVPGVSADREPGRVVLAGRGLALRMVRDARLRGLSLWARSER